MIKKDRPGLIKANIRKILITTRLIMGFLIFSSSVSYASSTYCQNTFLSVNLQNATIKDVFNAIEKDSEYIFMYYDGLLDVNKKVSVNVQNQTVDKILDKVFVGTELAYEISDRQILVKKAVPIPPPTPQQDNNTLQVQGRVLDENGATLPGVNIMIKGTDQGAMSDVDGNYQISAIKGQTLVFSYLGYKNEEVLVSTRTTIDVILKEDVLGMDEVVVVGMGTQKKASVIGAISSVSVAGLKVPSRSLTNSLSGRMAGIVAVQRSGEPGYDNSNFWIRGISTFGANQSPLILVDGVERSMDNLDPEEIESVSILKDASATAVYGVRAANGVVLVTTRKGVASSKPSIDFKVEYGVSTLTRLPKQLDGVGFTTLYNEAFGREYYSQDYINKTGTGEDPYLYPNVNWIKELFKDKADNMSAAFNVRGGGQVARYFIAFSYLGENGNLRTDSKNDYNSNIKLNRYNFRSNVDVNLTKTTLVDLEVGGNLIDSNYPAVATGDLFDKAYIATPIVYPVKYPMGENADGSTNYVWAGTASATYENPVERLMGSGYATEFRNTFNSQVRLSQDFGQWVKGLKANVAFSFDAYNQTNMSWKKKDSYYIANGRDADGNLDLNQTVVGDEFLKYQEAKKYTNRRIEFKTQIQYDNVFAQKHYINSMLMYYQQDYRDGDAEDNIHAIPYRKQGLAFRLAYSFRNIYFGEFNIGYNGSENFPKNQRFGVFPAGALGYLISNENFWQESALASAVNVLKLKGSMGLVGAEALPDKRRFAYQTIVGNGLGNYNFGEANNEYGGTGENQIGVQHLTWEKGLKSNIGFELQLIDGLVSLSADYFHEKRYDILIQRSSLPAIVGINDKPFANMGKMRNQGVDGTIEIGQHFKDFSYKVYGNATFTKNKVLFKDEPENKYSYMDKTGQVHNQNFGLIALGYFESEEDIKNSPTQTFSTVRPGDIKYLDVNGDGVIDAYDQVPIGFSDIPELIYGFGFQVEYKGVDFGMFFRGQARVNYMAGGNGFVPFKDGNAIGNLFEQALDRWTVDNPSQDTFYPRLTSNVTGNNYQPSTKWLYDGSLLRLADVEIGYSFPKKWMKKYAIEGLRIYCHGSNLALMSKWKLWDPETGSDNGGRYPLQRKINFGARINF